jgi:hypothetical protein
MLLTILLLSFLGGCRVLSYDYARSWSLVGRQEQIIFDESSQSSDNFGSSVALHNDLLVVGAYSARLTGKSIPSGSVYIYRRIDNRWLREDKLYIVNSTNRDYYGWSVSVHHNFIAVGAYLAFGDKYSVGLVYTYMYHEGRRRWIAQRVLGASGTMAPGQESRSGWGSNVIPDFDYFGDAVGIYNGTVIVGSYGDDEFGSFSGCGYIFEYSLDHRVNLQLNNSAGIATTWSRKQKLVPSDGRAFKNFGWSVAIDRDIIAVGAYGDVVTGNHYAGSVYVFNRMSAAGGLFVWSQTAKLIASNGGKDSYFGWSVAMHNDIIAVGSHIANTDEQRSNGAVYIFSKENIADINLWVQRTIVHSYILDSTQYFGYSLSMHDSYLLVGAAGGDSVGGKGGYAMLYSLVVADDGSVEAIKEVTLRPFTTSTDPNRQTSTETGAVPDFANAIAIYDSSIAIGAGRADGVDAETGVVYSYTAGLDYFPVGTSTYEFLVYFLPGGFALILVTSFIFVQIGNCISDRDGSSEKGQLLDVTSRHGGIDDSEVGISMSSDIMLDTVLQS